MRADAVRDHDTELRRLTSLDAGEPDLRSLRSELEAQSREDRAAIAEIKSDRALVHRQLDQINAGIIAIQTHSLRQTSGVAFALSVLIVIAWKAIGG
jgi:hypothetical protein